MTPERWSEVKAVFQEALGVDEASRAAHLDRACGADAELRSEVESLLASYDGAGSFMAATPVMRCSHCDSLYTLAHVVCPADGEVLVEDPSTSSTTSRP